MATLKPFAAIRPKPGLAQQICELPYDVLSSGEARRAAADNPLSFFHVSKPEIDLPEGTDPCAPAVYAKGRENFERLRREGALVQDGSPRLYLYQQVWGRHRQTGFAGVASCEEYVAGTIKKHELTRPEKEDDRVRHIEALDAQTGPVFLFYRGAQELTEFIAQKTNAEPETAFTADDGVTHAAWSITAPEELEWVEEMFQRIPALYIADGHHRCAAAGRVFQSRNGKGGSGFFLSVVFPHEQLKILPYHRVVRDLNGRSASEVLAELEALFVIKSVTEPAPRRCHELALFLEGKWHSLHFRPQFVATTDPIEKLDATLLQKHVLGPLFGIENVRTSKRIDFVGGIRGTEELERLVRSGEFACAFAMHPTGIEELIEVADAGAIMPPKSTWFEPKLRDAMFCHGL